VEFTKERIGRNYAPLGTAKLYVDDEGMAQDEIRTIAAFYALCGEGLCIGYDSGDAVSSAHTPKFEWSGGQILKVVFDVADDAYVDIERHLAAAMARD
jgi:arylsulfatase